MVKFFFAISILIVMIMQTALADGKTPPTYYQDHAKGWFWYHDRKQKKITTTLSTPNVPQAMAEIAQIRDPIARVKAIQHLLTETKDVAALSPTLPHIKMYLQLQNAVSTQASKLRQNWQTLLLDDPSLDFNVGHPTSEWANLSAVHQENRQQTNAIKAFAQTHGLFLFYRGTCPHCRHFAPVLKQFVQYYGFHLIPVTLDGLALPEFPNSTRDDGQAARLHVTEVPSLFAVDPSTRQVVALGAGDRTFDQLRHDILTAMQYDNATQGQGHATTN